MTPESPARPAPTTDHAKHVNHLAAAANAVKTAILELHKAREFSRSCDEGYYIDELEQLYKGDGFGTGSGLAELVEIIAREGGAK